MSFISQFVDRLLTTDWRFKSMMREAFVFQCADNLIYAEWVNRIMIGGQEFNKEDTVYPFLPISFFKSKIVQSGSWQAEQVFTSSGTTGKNASSHYLYSAKDYDAITQLGFETFYGPIQDYQILALLPSYFEQPSSSLLHMIDHFIDLSLNNGSKYILPKKGKIDLLKLVNKKAKKVLLWGVGYALLDIIDEQECFLPIDSIVLETGGMKGRRKEISKEAMHSILEVGFGVDKIHSEYGMTELSSQAYSYGDGLFYPSPTMKVMVNDINDPLDVRSKGRGQLNIIDLANIHSCCFIQTEDVGEVYDDGSFRVFGRLDNSQLRGCNLLHPLM